MDWVGLGEKPFNQAIMAVEFMADDGGSQSDTVRVMDFAQEFAAAIAVFGIRGVGFGILAFLAVEDAVGADVQESGAARLAEQGEAMGKQGVDGDGKQRVFGNGQLLDDANAVDHDVRLHVSENPSECVRIAGFHAA